MAFPVLLALAVLQAYSSAKQAEEVRRAADLQNDLNKVNAKYLDYDAFQAEIFGYTESADYDKEISKVISEQRVGFAAQGVDVSYGTAAEIQQETRNVGALNIIDIQNAARMRAQGIKQQAQNVRQGGNLQRDQAYINARANETAGYIQAGSTGYRGYTQLGEQNPNYLGGSDKTSTRVRTAGQSYKNYGGTA
jgi:hypothetical protein